MSKFLDKCTYALRVRKFILMKIIGTTVKAHTKIIRLTR